MEKLARLSLISKVTKELSNHLPLPADAIQDVVNMIVTEGEESKSLQDFEDRLRETQLDADLVKLLYSLISKLSPLKKPRAASHASGASSSTAPSERQTPSGDRQTLSGQRQSQQGPALSQGNADSSRQESPPSDAPPTEGPVAKLAKSFPGLAIKNDPNRPELRFNRPDEHAPLSQKALQMLEAEGGRRYRKSAYDKTESESESSDSEDGQFGALTGIPLEDDRPPPRRQEGAESKRRRLNGYELWEAQQLMASGVGSAPVETGDGEIEEDIEIEINENEPSFLKNQTGIEFSPIKILAVPDGSLAKAASAAALQARERRDIRDQQRKQLLESQGPDDRRAFGDRQSSPERQFSEFNDRQFGDRQSNDRQFNDRQFNYRQNSERRYGLEPDNRDRSWEDPTAKPGQRTITATLQRGLQDMQSFKAQQQLRRYPKSTPSARPKQTILQQKKSLPIYSLKDDILEAIKQNKVLILIGETGCGKTTQLTQYLYDAGYCSDGRMIGCTQPRRVAAISIANRVSEEMGCMLGKECGYTIRFEDVTSQETRIKYMTDGILLREMVVDKSLRRYRIIILDEAHERRISTDILFGLIKSIVMPDGCPYEEGPKSGGEGPRSRGENSRSRGLKLIVTSATLDSIKFSNYFNNAKIFTIPGRSYPVEIYYIKEPIQDYVNVSLMTVLKIHLTESKGDILLFLTGQEEIDSACILLNERINALKQKIGGGEARIPPLIILPVYSALPSEVQSVIFDPAPEGCRKCIIATNIAEASLTIDGIKYVIDPGLSKIKIYSSENNSENLTIIPISQANAKQRTGRAGRIGPGKCYRLYTEFSYQHEMLPTAIPEIQRINLTNTVLQLKAMGINDLINFNFMDPPPIKTLIKSMKTLYELGALDNDGLMTKLGRKIAEFPMEPQLGKMLLASLDLKCSDQIITIISMLQIENIFYRPKDRQNAADQKKSKFFNPFGDHITYLQIYRTWQSQQFNNQWCYDNFIQAKSLKKAQELRKQLIGIMDRYKLSPFRHSGTGQEETTDYTRVRKSICAGYFHHAARKDTKEGYKLLVDGQQVYLHPSSCLYQSHPEFIIYHELVMTTKEYLRDCCTIDPLWLTQLAPNLYKLSSGVSTRRQKEKIEPLYNRYEEPNAWRLTRRRI